MAFNKAKALLEAHKYVVQGKNALAIKQYLLILESDPSDLTLLNTVGDLYVLDKNIPEGLKLFYKLAGAYVREGFIIQSIAIYKKIIKIDNSSAEPCLKLAELYLTQGLTREAREQYSNAFEFYRRTKQKDKALEVLCKLARREPGSPNTHLKLAHYAESLGEAKLAADAYLEAAKAAQQKGDISTAENALNKAKELVPDNPELQLFRAQQAFNQQQSDQVEGILASVPDLQNDPRAQQLLLKGYLAAHDLDAARRLLLDVFRRDPSDFSPVADYATQCIANQDYDRAFEAASSVAQDLIGQKKTEPLMGVLRKIWAAAPQRIDNLELIYSIGEKTADEHLVPEVLEALGHAYVQASEPIKAEQAFAKLVACEPLNESYKGMLNQVRRKLGKDSLGPDISALSSAGAPLEAASASSALPETTEVGSYPAAAAGQVLAPEEIDLTQSFADLSSSGEEETPLMPQEAPVEFKAFPEVSHTPKEDSPTAMEVPSGKETSPAAELHEPAAEAAPPYNDQENREEIEFYVAHGFHEEAERVVSDLEKKYPEEPAITALSQFVAESRRKQAREGLPVGTPTGESPTLPQSAAPAGQPDMWVDFTGELASAFGEFQAPESRPVTSDLATESNSPLQSGDEASAELSSLLEELEAGEPAEKEPDDPQTHYNLGVAFREMGLYDEAIGEFQKAVKGATPDHFPPNFLQACTLVAACFMDKGMPIVAANWYSRALEISGLDEDADLALRYDLGTAYEQAGNPKRALEKFIEVYSQNIDYRDVAEKIRILRQKAS
jgi:tetratricopeptide (TPR) repeat protein